MGSVNQPIIIISLNWDCLINSKFKESIQSIIENQTKNK